MCCPWYFTNICKKQWQIVANVILRKYFLKENKIKPLKASELEKDMSSNKRIRKFVNCGGIVELLTRRISNLRFKPCQEQAVVSLSKKHDTYCRVLVGSRNESRLFL